MDQFKTARLIASITLANHVNLGHQNKNVLHKMEMALYGVITHQQKVSYPITPFKGAAPLGGSIKDFTIFWKTKSSKMGTCALFFSPYF